MEKKMLFALCISVLVLGSMPFFTGTVEAASWTGYVSTDALNVRAAPNTSATILDVLSSGEAVTVVAEVTGETVLGVSTWYQISMGGYVTSVYISESSNESLSGGGSAGPGVRWIDIDVGSQTATAYVGGEPIYTAPVTTGRASTPTPVGTFTIFSRIFNETMVSTTPGDSYYLENVYFTQYFAGGGYALHANYWQPDYVFGNTPTSHGCVGMRYGDAAFFWDFADYGTQVVVHY